MLRLRVEIRADPRIEEQLTAFIIHNNETVTVTLSGVPNGDFQPYLDALKQVAASIRFRS
jgi:hypothetical protein